MHVQLIINRKPNQLTTYQINKLLSDIKKQKEKQSHYIKVKQL